MLCPFPKASMSEGNGSQEQRLRAVSGLCSGGSAGRVWKERSKVQRLGGFPGPLGADCERSQVGGLVGGNVWHVFAIVKPSAESTSGGASRMELSR